MSCCISSQYDKMLSYGLVFLLAVGAYGAAVPRSELTVRPRIVGGTPVKDIKKYPHQLSLESYMGHYCGASIITNYYALSAGHCTNIVEKPYFEDVPRGDALRGGSTELGQGVNHKVKRVLTHPKYDESTHDYDVGLLEVQIPFVFRPELRPVQLAYQPVYPEEKMLVTMTGWGLTEEEGKPSETLLEMQVETVSLDQCEKLYAEKGSTITPRMFCAGLVERGGKDGCNGDSGNALLNSKTGDQIGIMSWGLGCGRPNQPGVYTNIADSEIRQFIVESVIIGPN